jgi:hypothetical protein
MNVDDYKDKELMKNDRYFKYYYGSIRLFIIVLISFNISPFSIINDRSYKYIFDNQLLSLYISSYRWISHLFFGSIGAIINYLSIYLYFYLSI